MHLSHLSHTCRGLQMQACVACRAPSALTAQTLLGYQPFQGISSSEPRHSRQRHSRLLTLVARLEAPGPAGTTGSSSYNARSSVSDRDGTAGPQTQIPASDRAALSSSRPRPPVTPSVVRSYEVPLWGRSPSRTRLQEWHISPFGQSS